MNPLFDTDVCIDFLRGLPEAVALFGGLEEPPRISAITVGELYAGVRPHERTDLARFISGADVLEITREIAERGGEFRNRFKKSHKVELDDALIAATAELHGLSLHTLNGKHFPMASVTVPYSKS